MKKIKFLILTSLTTLLMAPVTYASLTKTSENPVTNVLISQGLKSEEIKQKAEAITVKIESDNSAGSGVIIGKEGNTYTVLTNAHVVNRKVPNQVITIDGKIHESKVIQEGNSLEGNDLAVLTFNSPHNYQVANLPIDSDIKENQVVYSVGFPEETNEFYFSQGTVKLTAPKPFLGGYQIGYDIDVKAGMSGGALLNEKGELIGVNGLLKGPVLNEAYNYLDGSQPFEQNIATYRNLSFAVPVETLIDVAPNLALIPNEWKTGLNIAENVDNIARQITVRIDNKQGVNGSGAIVGKDGDTYYVFTACHVVSDNKCQSGKVKSDYTLVTPDGERYPLNANNIILSQGMDVAIIKFKSKTAYRVATIGKYNTSRLQKHLVFVSGFPTELKGVRKLTPGYRLHLDKGLGVALKSNHQDIKIRVDTSGYELSYTNLSKPGMSGGPVLDINGQVIGINTGQDDEEISKTVDRQLGYAYGVPATRFLAFADKKKVNLNLFTIIDKMPVPLKDQDLKIAKQHPSFIIEKPPENSDENAWLNYGNKLWRIRRYKEAIAAFNKAIEINPELPEAHYALGLVYATQAYNTDNDSLEMKAIAAFDQAISLRPYSLDTTWLLTPQAWYRKSISLSNVGKHEEALVAIDEAIKFIDDDAKFYKQQGFVLVDLKRYVEAKEAYTKSLIISPLPHTYGSRCSLLVVYLNEPEASIKDCNEAIKLGVIEAYSFRGLAHFDLGNEQAALADHNQAVVLAPNSYFSYMFRAFTYNDMGEYELAIADYTKAIEVDPQNRSLADLYSQLGNMYYMMGDYKQGIVNYTKAIEIDPSDPEFYAQRGRYYDANGQYALAIQDMTKAIELKRDHAQYYNGRASFKSSLGDSQGALEDYNRAIDLDPNDSRGYWGRSQVYMLSFQDFVKAMEDLTKAIELNPKFGKAYESRGLLRKFLSDLPGALEDYNRAIALIEAPDPVISFVYFGRLPEELEALSSQQLKRKDSHIGDSAYRARGNIRLQLKDYQGALEDYNEAIRRNPNDANNYVSRGDYYTQTNQPEKAKADYNKAIEVYSDTIKTDPDNPQNFIVYSSRGNVYSKLNNYESAIADLTKTIELTKINKYIYYAVRANLYEEIEEYELAIQDFSKVIELKPEFIAGYGKRGLIYYLFKKNEAAIKDFSKVVELNKKLQLSEYFVTYLLRGELYQKSKNYPEAIKDFSSFIKLQPKDHQGYTYRCMSYTELKDYNQAINDCNQAIKIAPNNPEVYLANAMLNSGLKNYSAALKYANKIIELTPDLPIGYTVRGIIYWGQNNPNQALSDYKLALSKNDQFAPAISSIGLIKYAQGDKQKAVKLWQKAVTIQDDLADTKLALAVGLYHQGQPEKALSLAKEAIDMDGRLRDINHLKDNLWGEQLIKDTEPLLNKLK